jgi:hypothetical protein
MDFEKVGQKENKNEKGLELPENNQETFLNSIKNKAEEVQGGFTAKLENIRTIFKKNVENIESTQEPTFDNEMNVIALEGEKLKEEFDDSLKIETPKNLGKPPAIEEFEVNKSEAEGKDEDKEEEKKPEGKCPKCGIETGGTTFCTNCGTNLQEKAGEMEVKKILEKFSRTKEKTGFSLHGVDRALDDLSMVEFFRNDAKRYLEISNITKEFFISAAEANGLSVHFNIGDNSLGKNASEMTEHLLNIDKIAKEAKILADSFKSISSKEEWDGKKEVMDRFIREIKSEFFQITRIEIMQKMKNDPDYRKKMEKVNRLEINISGRCSKCGTEFPLGAANCPNCGLGLSSIQNISKAATQNSPRSYGNNIQEETEKLRRQNEEKLKKILGRS